jgi:hypothetical protein
MVATYAPDAAGRLLPVLPCTCPYHEQGGAPCRLRIDHFRERKTGPCFALAVVRCSVHAKAFTLYPPGHVPYGRIAIAPVSSDGSLVRNDDQQGASKSTLDWSRTLFGAATDAAGAKAWPRKKPARWRTQRRWLARGAELVGILTSKPARDAAVEQRRREQAARELGIPTLTVLEATEQWRRAGGYRSRGTAVVTVLTELRPSRRLADQMLGAGVLAGLWGSPIRGQTASSITCSLSV